MNRKKGTLRIAIVLSILSIALGVLLLASGADEEVGFSICVFGPVFVWISYWGFWFVLKGFDAIACDNCEKNIGKLEDKFNFRDHTICAECNKKLNDNQKEGVS